MTSEIANVFFQVAAGLGLGCLVLLSLCWRPRAIALVLVLTLITCGQPAFAAMQPSFPLAALGASDQATSTQQNQFEEDQLKLDPTGGHYKGIEYSNKEVRRQRSDDQILKEIESEIANKNVVIAVSNGSVRLSGRMLDRATAKEAVESVKDISGVHEVAFDLGLERNER